MNTPTDALEAPTSSASLRKLLGRFAPFYFMDTARITLAAACGIATSVLAIAALWPIRLLIDSILLRNPDPSRIVSWLSQLDAIPAAAALAALAAALAIAATLTSAAEKNLNARLREAMTLRLRMALLDDVMARPASSLTGLKTGEIVLRVIDDTGQVARLFCKTWPVLLRYAATLVSALVAMFAVGWIMGLVGTAIVLMMAGLMLVSAERLQSSSRAKRRTEGAVAGFTQEVLRNLRFVRAVGGEAATRSLFAARNADALATGVAETRESVRLEQRIQIANALAVLAITASGAWLAVRGQISVGDLTLCLACLTQLLKPVEKLNDLSSTVTGALTRAERLASFLPAERPTSAASIATPASPQPPAISLRLTGVTFAHAADRPLLRDLNLDVRDGELLWITGRSGSGKSTLVDLLLRLVEPQRGEISLNGRTSREWPLSQWRAHFAVVLQSPQIMAGNVRDAVSFGNSPLPDHALWEALDAAGLGDCVRAMPGQLNDPLTEGGANLSGGQRARLQLARALASRRPILVLDEPLASLDLKSQSEVMATLQRLRGSHTILFISHQAIPRAVFDRIAYLDAGQIRQGCTSGRAVS